MGISGNGTTLGYADTAEATPTTISEILQITPGKRTVKDVTWTPLADADGHAKHAPGSKDSSALSFNLPFEKTIVAALEALESLVKYWTVTYPDGSTRVGPGYVMETGEETIAPDALLTTAVQIMPTAKWTLTPAA